MNIKSDLILVEITLRNDDITLPTLVILIPYYLHQVSASFENSFFFRIRSINFFFNCLKSILFYSSCP